MTPKQILPGQWVVRLGTRPLIPLILTAVDLADARRQVLQKYHWRRLPAYTRIRERELICPRYIERGSLVRRESGEWGVFSCYPHTQTGHTWSIIQCDDGHTHVLPPHEYLEVILTGIGCARTLIRMARHSGYLEETVSE